MGTIVVGVDGSECARTALRFAAKEAALRKAKVRAVTAWHLPLGSFGSGWAASSETLVEDCEKAAEETLDEALENLGELGEGLELERVVREGQPAEILVDEAREAELLVVGSRGRGGFRELLLGSVSQQCAHHASCPVAIVRKGCLDESASRPAPES
jgi:nucleotide-binding universal stress UspA family protein